MTYEELHSLIKDVAEKEIEKSVSFFSSSSDTADKISDIIINDLKNKDKDNNKYTFIILGSYESELIKETVIGNRLIVDEYNYILCDDNEIVFSIPQENVVYVRKDWLIIFRYVVYFTNTD